MADQSGNSDQKEDQTNEEPTNRDVLNQDLFMYMMTAEWEEFLKALDIMPDVNHFLSIKCTKKCHLGQMFESFSCRMQTWFGLATDRQCQCLQDDDSSAVVEYVGVTPMHFAATLDDDRFIRELMRRGGLVNVRTLRLQLGPLNLAAHRHIGPLQALLSTCSQNAKGSLESNVSETETTKRCAECGATPCTCGSPSEHSTTVNVCDVNIVGANGRTAFLTAVMHDFGDGAEELMRYGADVNKMDRYSTVPVIEATRRKYSLEFFEKMVKAGCVVDACPPGNHDVALHYAVYMEMGPHVELLLQNGTHPDMVGQSHTPLVIAAFVGSVENVRTLAKYGADVNKRSVPADYTALHFAAWEGHVNICEELVRCGANPDLQTRDLNTPLSLGAHGNFYKVVDFFLSLGKCDVNNKDKDRDTALHYASYNGDVESTKSLLEHGAEANARNAVNATPLWNACYMNRLEVVKILVEHNVVMELPSRGIDQHSQTDEVVLIYDAPKSPLYAAAEQGGYDVVRYLVQEGYDINREHWIHLVQFPSRLLNGDEETRSWLEEEYHMPRSLIQISRRVINGLLGDSIVEKSELLELPRTLREYLLHEY